MDWDDAMTEAREEHGYSENEYVEDWDELVDTAQDIYDDSKQEEYEEFCEDAHNQYKEYLKSERWKELRLKILKRDKFKCQDCGKSAVDVHHTDYSYLRTDQEFKYCVSLCRECHKKRHNILKNDENIQKISEKGEK